MSFLGRSSHGELNGFLDAGSHMQGELHFEQTFRIEGRLTGQVVSEGDLVVGEKGEVEGEIRVGRAMITGTVRGLIRATRRVEIGPGGRVTADIETPSLVVDDGALFEGNCRMSRSAAPPAEAGGAKILARLPAAGSR